MHIVSTKKAQQQLLYERSMQRVERAMVLIDDSYVALEEAAALLGRSLPLVERLQWEKSIRAASVHTLS